MATISASIRIFDGMTQPLRSMLNASNLLISSFESMQDASGRAVNTAGLAAARNELANAGAQMTRMEEDITRANQRQQQFNKNLHSGGSAADRLTSSIRNMAAAYLSFQSTKSLLGLSDIMASTDARLNLIVDDGGSVDNLRNKIFASAQAARAAYTDTAAAIAKLSLNAGAAFKNNNETTAFMEQVNKQFVIGGANAQEIAGSMIQLTQAMASGALRGEELNSILDAAPGIARAIEKYMGISEGSIKKVAEQGLVTSQVVKNAMFAAAEETNRRFESMPMTFGQVMTSISNQALMKFRPILDELNKMANGSNFEKVASGFINGISMIAYAAVKLFGVIGAIASFFVNNWGMFKPLIMGIVGAMILYKSVVLGVAVAKGILSAQTSLAAFMESVYAIRVGAANAALAGQTAATFLQTEAQYGLNAALYACPIVWIVIAIIAVIAAMVAALYIMIAIINKWKGTSISATGIIAGHFMLLMAFIHNNFVVPFWNSFAALGNFFGNVFNSPVAAVKVLFYDLALTVMGYMRTMASAIETMINKIPGIKVDITSGFDGFYSKLEKAQKKVKDKSGWVEYMGKLNYADYGKAYSTGYDWGKGAVDKLSNLGSFSNPLGDGIGGMGNVINGIKDDTGKMKDSMEITEEDLKYLRDIAERDVINRFTTAEIKVEMSNTFGDIRETVDVDGVLDHLTTKIGEQMAVAAEGVHN